MVLVSHLKELSLSCFSILHEAFNLATPIDERSNESG